jgi:hypothetical protein
MGCTWPATLSRRPSGPKRKTIYAKTRQQVAEKLTKAMADRDGRFIFEDGNMRVGAYLARGLRSLPALSGRVPSTATKLLSGFTSGPALGRLR